MSGNTVTLTRGTTIERDLTVPAGVTLELTGDGGLWLLDNITLTVNGTVNAPSNRIGFDDSGARTITINGNGTINLTSKGSLIGVGENRKLTLDGVTLVGIADNDSPLVRTGERGELVLVSGAITGNSTNHSGAGVFVDTRGTFTMSGGAIFGNTTTGNGGGVFVGEGSVFTMSGGAISDNNTISARDAGGGGVRVERGTFTMSGGAISGNTVNTIVGAGGGGVRIGEDSTFTMSGGAIYGNSVQTSTGGSGAGGVFISNRSTFIMEGGRIQGGTDSDGFTRNISRMGSDGLQSAALEVSQSTARWGTGGTYTKGGVSQIGGGNIASTNDTLIAIPVR
ncbi:MAG: hypothetical protein LBQ89_06305 [Treponema sp.]|nr:hypothetical protein [Treponema sp.]